MVLLDGKSKYYAREWSNHGFDLFKAFVYANGNSEINAYLNCVKISVYSAEMP